MAAELLPRLEEMKKDVKVEKRNEEKGNLQGLEK
jgi:hypothetical protein